MFAKLFADVNSKFSETSRNHFIIFIIVLRELGRRNVRSTKPLGLLVLGPLRISLELDYIEDRLI
jgi:hypothetical protein